MPNPTPRILREAKILTKEKLPGLIAFQNPENYRLFLVSIDGPKNTPYDGGTFEADMLLPEDYPMNPPKI